MTYQDANRFATGTATYAGKSLPVACVETRFDPANSDCGDCSHPASQHGSDGCIALDGGQTCICQITGEQVIQDNCDNWWHTASKGSHDDEPTCPECGDTE